jgi:hypothetical protein
MYDPVYQECICFDGWQGEYCNETVADPIMGAPSSSTGMEQIPEPSSSSGLSDADITVIAVASTLGGLAAIGIIWAVMSSALRAAPAALASSAETQAVTQRLLAKKYKA